MTDYEKVYQKEENALGAPFAEFVTFFNELDQTELRVLDLGCGQGRDAIIIAQMGHKVLGVDGSKTGIKQLLNRAEKDNLPIKGIVSDLMEYQPNSTFDIIIIDRVLHMFKDDSDKMDLIAKSKNALTDGGFILIADIPKNKAFIHRQFTFDSWKPVLDKKGFSFYCKSK